MRLAALVIAGFVFCGAAAADERSIAPNVGPPTTCEVWEASELVEISTPSAPFATDGCSLWPDGSWRECCVEHDAYYWCGGSYADRLEADRRLRRCVEDAMGAIMFLGVRIGGGSLWPAPYRWGFGWPWPRAGP